MNVCEFKKTIRILLNPTTTFVSQGPKTVIAIPAEDKKDKKTTDN